MKVYIVGAKRSPIGSFLGSLSSPSAGELSSQVLSSILKENNIPANKIDEVLVGNVLSAGQGQGVDRQVSILSGIPMEVPRMKIFNQLLVLFMNQKKKWP